VLSPLTIRFLCSWLGQVYYAGHSGSWLYFPQRKLLWFIRATARLCGSDIPPPTPKFETKSAFVLHYINTCGEWRYSATHSLPWYQVRVNGRLRNPATLPLGRTPPSRPYWICALVFAIAGLDARVLSLIGSRFLGCAARSIVTKHTHSSSEILSSCR